MKAFLSLNYESSMKQVCFSFFIQTTQNLHVSGGNNELNDPLFFFVFIGFPVQSYGSHMVVFMCGFTFELYN